MNEIYIVSRDFLSSWNFSLRIILMRNHAFVLVQLMCSCQLLSFENTIDPGVYTNEIKV